MKIPEPLTADEIRTAQATLAQIANCARPGCPEFIRFRPGRGRRQRFCSGACRAKYSRERARLYRLWTRLHDTADLPDPPLPTKRVGQVADQVSWLLEGYGGVGAIPGPGTRSPAPQPPPEAIYLETLVSQHEEVIRRMAEMLEFIDVVVDSVRKRRSLVNPDEPQAPQRRPRTRRAQR